MNPHYKYPNKLPPKLTISLFSANKQTLTTMMNSQEQQQSSSIQETQTEQPTNNFDSEVIKYLAMLHLNNTTSSAITTAPTTPVSSIIHHRLSRKRSSPTSSSILRRKLLSKKPALSPPSTTPLQRTLSEPVNFSPVQPTVTNSLAITPETSKNADSAPKSASKPPLPPLRRTSSAPAPSDYQLMFTSNVTPPTEMVSSPARAMVGSPVSDEEESASAKRLKRMKESMLVMTDWVQQVLCEDDEQPVIDQLAETGTVECDKDDEAEADNGAEECVWVDENPGGSLTIHFKCPCGKAYEVLLSGNNCYYKLK